MPLPALVSVDEPAITELIAAVPALEPVSTVKTELAPSVIVLEPMV